MAALACKMNKQIFPFQGKICFFVCKEGLMGWEKATHDLKK